VFEQQHDLAGGDGVMRTGRYVRQTFTLHADLCASLRDLSSRRHSTFGETLLTAWLATLYRLTGRDELIIGIPGDGRADGERIASGGLSTATHVLHVDLSGNPTVSSLLARVTEVAERAAEWGRLALKVPDSASGRNALSLQRDHAPALQLRFELTEETERRAPTVLGVSAQESDAFGGGHDLGLFLSEVRQEIEGAAEYNPKLLDSLAASEMIEYFKHVAEVITAHPDKHLDDVLGRAAEGLVMPTLSDTPQAQDAADRFAF
jgi:non-ribosomal peptide synthetase component F